MGDCEENPMAPGVMGSLLDVLMTGGEGSLCEGGARKRPLRM